MKIRTLEVLLARDYPIKELHHVPKLPHMLPTKSHILSQHPYLLRICCVTLAREHSLSHYVYFFSPLFTHFLRSHHISRSVSLCNCSLLRARSLFLPTLRSCLVYQLLWLCHASFAFNRFFLQHPATTSSRFIKHCVIL